MLEYRIQIENRPRDLCPNDIDRMTGQNIQDRGAGLSSLGRPYCFSPDAETRLQ